MAQREFDPVQINAIHTRETSKLVLLDRKNLSPALVAMSLTVREMLSLIFYNNIFIANVGEYAQLRKITFNLLIDILIYIEPSTMADAIFAAIAIRGACVSTPGLPFSPNPNQQI